MTDIESYYKLIFLVKCGFFKHVLPVVIKMYCWPTIIYGSNIFSHTYTIFLLKALISYLNTFL